jgi:hypothetical protein
MNMNQPTIRNRPHDETGTPSALLRDDRGVIMVVGVFFSLLLIGLCWFIFGIGNAIAYRENLQNASDSAAFAAAVYDARGMNLLAMMNIIMGVILATLIIAKFLEIIAVMADLGDCNGSITSTEECFGTIIGALGPCEIKAAATVVTCVKDCKDVASWQKNLKSYDSGVHSALTVLHDAEVGIAVGWPWIAAGKSGNVQFYYKDSFNLKNGAAVTTSFAYSQIPWSLDNDTGSLLSGDTSQTKGEPADKQTRYGLPVESDTYADLCIASFNDISNLGGVIPANPISKFVSGALDWMSQWFCDDGTGSAIPTVLIEDAPDVAFTQAVAFCIIQNDIPKILKALKGGALKVNDAASQLPMSMDPPGVKKDNYSYSPMALYKPAKMGLDYFGVWSTAIGDYDDKLSSSRVQIAGQQGKSGTKIVSDPTVDVPDLYVGVSKAEFYYDPQKGDTTDKETKMTTANQPLDVMWNMRWRARLRRYHYFPGADGIGDAAIDLMNKGFASVASAAVSSLLNGKNPLTDLVGSTSVNELPTKGAPDIFH